jgi:hypothetical protein
MEKLATAIALAVIYIENRPEKPSEDSDINALEDIAICLSRASITQQNAVADAFKELGFPKLIEELGLLPNDG